MNPAPNLTFLLQCHVFGNSLVDERDEIESFSSTFKQLCQRFAGSSFLKREDLLLLFAFRDSYLKVSRFWAAGLEERSN